MIEAPGRVERALARRLVAELAADMPHALQWRSVELGPVAEHVLYTALRHGQGGGEGEPFVRDALRVARALSRSRRPARLTAEARVRIVVVVTQPIHVTLYQPIARRLEEQGVQSVLIDGETRGGRAVRSRVIDARLLHFLRPNDGPSLVAHAWSVGRLLSDAPSAWLAHRSPSAARRHLALVRRGVLLAAIEATRIHAMLARVGPDAVACFSESGLLARLVPAAVAASNHPVPVVDLPHAEAADPWGSAGIGYDEVAVYGPRAADVMRTAGMADQRIVQIGPLGYDRLLAASPARPPDNPRRVLFASQPARPSQPALHPDVKRRALWAAVTAAEAVRPADVVVLPHPTEPGNEPEQFVSGLRPPDGVTIRIESQRGLHEVLPGAWLLVTASSQSVFEAVLSGVPAVTVNPTKGPDPVTFASEGIALGVRSPEEAAHASRMLLDPANRSSRLAGMREALGSRLGPLDGRAADRAARWLAEVATRSHERSGRSPR